MVKIRHEKTIPRNITFIGLLEDTNLKYSVWNPNITAMSNILIEQSHV